MERRQKLDTGGMILGQCPACKGTGKIPRKPPFLANPRAPLTRPERLGFEPCPRCKGTGKVVLG